MPISPALKKAPSLDSKTVLIKPIDNLPSLRVRVSRGLIDAIQFVSTPQDDTPLLTSNDEITDLLQKWFKQYFKGDALPLSFLPLNWEIGTDFQQTVWQQLPQLAPYGETLSYGELSVKITGSVASARAIGMAMNKNPWHVVIPCHRVVGTNGDLTGYAAGLDTKKQLLEREKQAISHTLSRE